MKVLVATACICVIAATVGAGVVAFREYRKAESRDLMAKCRSLATTQPETLNEFERAEAKAIAEKCLAYIRS